MNILMVHSGRIPVYAYGGTERVAWDLAKGLHRRGHKITFLVPAGSQCDFARVIVWDRKRPVSAQVPPDTDIVHFHVMPDIDLDEEFGHPYIMTEHGNPRSITVRPRNTVFVSQDHARRFHARAFVHNGLDWDAYGPVDLDAKRHYFHFLGKGTRRAKNIGGTIDVARAAGVRLDVLGGHRMQVWKGFRLTPWPSVRFHGMVGGERKSRLLNGSRGLIFPVRWAEPFGLAITESLFFGCPVFATPYGSLNELIGPEVGVLSASRAELAAAVRSQAFDPRRCHEYARDTFGLAPMTEAYLRHYETVLSGATLHDTVPYVGSKAKGLWAWNP